MLTEKEKQFLHYWEQNRERDNSFIRKLTGGLPMAMLFSLPILLSVIAVWILSPGWQMKISQTSPGMIITAIFALILIVMFYSFFRMQYKWESNEQLFKELKQKENRINRVL